jgi:CCR4-NOT transcription complex subunit 7/8
MERHLLVTPPGSLTLNSTLGEDQFALVFIEEFIIYLFWYIFIPYYREDMYAQDSIELLQNSGLQFKKHEEEGIDPMDFAELMMTSGIVLMDNIKWLSFHSGYDFGYLLKILTNHHLPQEESEFFELLRIYFPNIYDVKYLMKSCKNLKGGLQEVADQLELERVGPQHQAGSDSLLTGLTFFKMREVHFLVKFSSLFFFCR